MEASLAILVNMRPLTSKASNPTVQLLIGVHAIRPLVLHLLSLLGFRFAIPHTKLLKKDIGRIKHTAGVARRGSLLVHEIGEQVGSNLVV